MSRCGLNLIKLACDPEYCEYNVSNGDVTKFEFKFDNVRTLYIFRRFKIRRIVKICFSRMRILGKVARRVARVYVKMIF